MAKAKKNTPAAIRAELTDMRVMLEAHPECLSATRSTVRAIGQALKGNWPDETRDDLAARRAKDAEPRRGR